MQNIQRSIYLKRIEPYIRKNLIKVIVGQRRVGKSFFLKQISNLFIKNYPEIPIIYINKEDLEFDSLQNYSDLVTYAESKRQNENLHAIFIDEIQDIEEFEKALRHLQTKQNWDIYCTGSNAHLLSGELATYLSGRYIEIQMYSLSYNEFLNFHKLENTTQNFNNYIKFGGLPYLVHLELDESIVYDYLKNIFRSILFKDIIGRHSIRNVAFIERLCLYIADNIGQIVSAKKITDYLKSQRISFSNNIVLDYLSFLQNAFLIFVLKRNDLKGKRILEIGEKIYFHDLGLRNAFNGYKHNDVSLMLENIILLHLLIHNYDVTIGKLGDKEIDFVCDKNNKRIYIQVTLSLADENVRVREIGNLLLITDNFRKIVVTADELTIDEKQGVEIWNIRKFLSSFFKE
ncbi:MAG: ATP-binding protein [Bacteroidales bacterium]|nr:ATP-binding protein [Bacteroidales bacterium]MBN2757898.1 ATP-binding protein [Bacteroidales bacterium]